MRESRQATARARNKARIRHIAARAPHDLEALALLFEDDHIADDGTIPGRMQAILAATERRTIPGLQTGIPFGDEGFAGDRADDSVGFRDPWPASRNQVGHFLTAVRLRLAPGIVSRPIPVLRSVRAIVGAPAEMCDAEVALRLSIGHEKVADPPNATEALMLVLAEGFVAARWALATDGSPRERARRIGLAMAKEGWRQIVGSLATFRTQFHAVTDEDVAAWQRALRAAGGRGGYDRRVLEGPHSPLLDIDVGRDEGNSRQDLRLTMAGWWLGEAIERGAFRDRRAVASWLRRTLG